MKKTILTLVLAIGAVFCTSFACTSVIVSGRVSPDGRPYIFKNRDTEGTDNLTMIINGTRYRFVAIVSAKDSVGHGAWSGHNEAGFAIANTAAYNLNGKIQPKQRQQRDQSKQPTDNDSNIMSKALGCCATLADFEHFLDSLLTLGPIPTNSNFAVLDAQGGCAYYETGNKGYVKYDANDPAQAPYGYLVRTNHGMSGDRDLDKGIERYLAISDYMNRAYFSGALGFENIIRGVTRHLTHGLTQINLRAQIPAADQQTFVPFRDFIPRYQTASAHLIQGVKAGEDPSLTVSWIIAGSPLTTVALPIVITRDSALPRIISRNQNGRATLVDAGFELKKKLFPFTRGNGADYLNLTVLLNQSGTGILQQIEPIETTIFQKAEAVLQTMRKNGKPGAEITDFYTWADKFITEQYKEKFNILL